jgi:hypothetical protein
MRLSADHIPVQRPTRFRLHWEQWAAVGVGLLTAAFWLFMFIRG